MKVRTELRGKEAVSDAGQAGVQLSLHHSHPRRILALGFSQRPHAIALFLAAEEALHHRRGPEGQLNLLAAHLPEYLATRSATNAALNEQRSVVFHLAWEVVHGRPQVALQLQRRSLLQKRHPHQLRLRLRPQSRQAGLNRQLHGVLLAIELILVALQLPKLPHSPSVSV